MDQPMEPSATLMHHTSWIVLLVENAPMIFMLASLALFLLAWSARRRGQILQCGGAGILLLALFQATTAVLQFSGVLRNTLYLRATMQWGAAQQAMAALDLAHALDRLNMGLVATAACLALRLLLPRQNSEK